MLVVVVVVVVVYWWFVLLQSLNNDGIEFVQFSFEIEAYFTVNFCLPSNGIIVHTHRTGSSHTFSRSIPAMHNVCDNGRAKRRHGSSGAFENKYYRQRFTSHSTSSSGRSSSHQHDMCVLDEEKSMAEAPSIHPPSVHPYMQVVPYRRRDGREWEIEF